MPSGRAHSNLQKRLLGRAYPDVNRALDAFRGQGHRKPTHNLGMVALIAALQGSDAGAAAATHILQDRADNLAKRALSEATGVNVFKLTKGTGLTENNPKTLLKRLALAKLLKG